jgi:hypothetical protein
MPMHKSVVVPNLETGFHVGEDIEAMSGLYCCLISIVLDDVRGPNVIAVIEEVHMVEGHASR